MAGLLDFLQSASNTAADTVAAPVDVLAWALRKAGVPVGTPVGGTDWMRQQGLRRDVPQSAASLAGETVGLLSPMVAATKAPQIAKGLLQVEANAAAPRTLRPEAGAIVWQGSPHKYDAEKLVRLPSGEQVYVGGKFNTLKEVPRGATVVQDFPLGRMRSEAIGTGEGAQAYGHGLYMAESRVVGSDYADVLASPRNRVADRRGVYIEPSPMGGGKYMLATKSEVGQPRGMASDATQFIYPDKEFANLASAMKFARQKGLLARDERPRLTAIGEDRKYVPVSKAADVVDPEYTQFIASDPGYLYKVDLPDPVIARMLDWDKPLSQQTKAVRNYFEPLTAKRRAVEAQAADPKWGDLAGPLNYDPTGGELLQLLGNVDRMDAAAVLSGGTGGAQTAALLRSAGIPGVRYLDASSRGVGQGTSNFVVFPGEENALRILERNGLLVP
jgi:hypothetical protein